MLSRLVMELQRFSLMIYCVVKQLQRLQVQLSKKLIVMDLSWSLALYTVVKIHMHNINT
jgi:hypothetical protein